MLDIIEGCIAYNYWNVQAETTMAIYWNANMTMRKNEKLNLFESVHRS